ncbi:hypothetical protein ADK57_27240 [Streptomyces sp. MMG1533]|uniref:beta family protein n=1 Tax=Streptomyces sp. MMG1533 TaxID=1415546 RepID=UPI0006AE328A|nr:hypothetical protein [Streptomyces sp. MMG1533]KOU61613.1 hypothetical protein ADK57_27240 [Streptomyces sp. MMG1533]
MLLARYLAKTAGDIRTKHGLHPGWVDARNAEDALELVVEHVWREICSGLLGCELRPVTGPERDPMQQGAAAEAAREWGNGLGVRVPGGGDDLRDQCRRMLVRVGGDHEELDLLLDLYEVGSADEGVARALRAWREIGTLAAWRTVVLLGGSFPWGAKQLKDHDLTVVPRAEWEVWREVRHRLGGDSRVVYGDYSTIHPLSGDAPPTRWPRIYEKPRYTTAENFLVGKGRLWGSGEESRMQQLAARIVGDPEFRRGSSAGELWLQDQADPDMPVSPGNPEVWVEKGHVQHITFVAGQLREPSG